MLLKHGRFEIYKTANKTFSKFWYSNFCVIWDKVEPAGMKKVAIFSTSGAYLNLIGSQKTDFRSAGESLITGAT